MESSKENVYYSDFVYGDFSKREIKHTEINIGLKKKTLRSSGGEEKFQIMETSLKDRNYRSEIQVQSVTSTNQTKAPCVGHIPAHLLTSQPKTRFYFLFVFLFFSPNCQHGKAIQLWVKQLCDILPPIPSTKLSAQFFFITGTDGIKCQGLGVGLCPLTLAYRGTLSLAPPFANLPFSLLPAPPPFFSVFSSFSSEKDHIGDII